MIMSIIFFSIQNNTNQCNAGSLTFSTIGRGGTRVLASSMSSMYRLAERSCSISLFCSAIRCLCSISVFDRLGRSNADVTTLPCCAATIEIEKKGSIEFKEPFWDVSYPWKLLVLICDAKPTISDSDIPHSPRKLLKYSLEFALINSNSSTNDVGNTISLNSFANFATTKRISKKGVARNWGIPKLGFKPVKFVFQHKEHRRLTAADHQFKSKQSEWQHRAPFIQCSHNRKVVDFRDGFNNVRNTIIE